MNSRRRLFVEIIVSLMADAEPDVGKKYILTLYTLYVMGIRYGDSDGVDGE